jgi:hypothetical protein
VLAEQTSNQLACEREDATQALRVGIQADKVNTHKASHTHRRDRSDALGGNMGGSVNALWN